MLDNIRRMLGAILVEESRDNIRISGIPADILANDISRIWGTSRINKNMFVNITRSRIEFPKFFALEFVYMLNKIAESGRLRHTRRVAKHIIAELTTNTWLSTTIEKQPDILDFRKLSMFKKTPLRHQQEFLDQYNTLVPQFGLGGYYLAAPPGAGKTINGLMLAECLGADYVIVIGPKNSVERVWKETLNTEYKAGPQPHWTSLDSVTPDPKKIKYFVAHYEAIGRLLNIAKEFKGKKTVVILDECHNMNEIKSQRTLNFIELCNDTQASDVLWASGTPLKATGAEMIPFLRTTDKLFSAKVEERFKKIFGMSAARAVDILSHRLGISSYRVPKKDVVASEPIEIDVAVTFPGAEKFTLEAISEEMKAFIAERVKFYRENYDDFKELYEECLNAFLAKVNPTGRDLAEFKEYRQAVKTLSKATDLRPYADMMVWVNRYELQVIIPNLPPELRKDFKAVRSVIKYVQLKIRGEALGRILGKRRTECNVAMIKHIGLSDIIDVTEKKTLIFTSFIEAVKEVDSHLRPLGYDPILVYGETTSDLKRMVDRFDRDPKVNPMVATYQSLSTAVPLTMANACILLNQPFRAHEKEQATSRIHRLGQDAQVRFYNVLLDTGDKVNISTRSLDIMKWSQDQVDLMLGVQTIDNRLSLEGIRLDELDNLSLEGLALVDRRLKQCGKLSVILDW
jgi:hypothetical protein